MLFLKAIKARSDLLMIKGFFKTDFSNKLLVTKKEIMYPTNVPHSKLFCTSHVPHLEISVPHSRP